MITHHNPHTNWPSRGALLRAVLLSFLALSWTSSLQAQTLPDPQDSGSSSESLDLIEPETSVTGEIPPSQTSEDASDRLRGSTIFSGLPGSTNGVGDRIEPSRSTRPASMGNMISRARRAAAVRDAYGGGQRPFTYRIGAGIDMDYDDNIFLTEDNTESDFIFRPQLRLGALWNISEMNTLTLEVTGGYDFYLDNSELDDWFIESTVGPASRLDAQFFIGDFVITVYDEVAFSARPFRVVSDTGSVPVDGDYGRLTNTIGADVLWDLNDLVVTAGINRFDYWSAGENVEQLQRGTTQLLGAARVTVGPRIQGGIEGSYSITDYDEDFQNDGDGFSLGGFVEWALSDATRLRGTLGWQDLSFDSGGGNGDSDNFGDWYASFLITNRLNQFITHSLDLGREAALGVNTNFIERSYIRYVADLDVIRNVTLSVEVGYADNDESGGTFEDDNETWFAGFNARYRLGPRLNLVGSYVYSDRDSTREGFGYEQNFVRLSLQYNY